MLLCDICNLDPPSGDNAILHVLAKTKIHPPWLADNLSQDIAFVIRQQNIDFEEADHTKLYGRLDQIISDFRHFKKYVLEYLK